MSEKKYTPCGGCGAETPLERCIGCFHPFESTQILKPKAEAFYWLNLADHFTEDWMLFHCRYTKDKMKLDTDSFELSDGWLIKKNGSGMLDLHEVEYLAESIWVLASSRLPNKDGIYKVRRMYSEGENKIKYSSGKFDNGIGYTVYEWLDEAQSESPAEQPVAESISDDQFPDLSSATPEQKAETINGLVELCAKNVLKMFYAFGLKTHIECTVVNDPTSETFDFIFRKRTAEQPVVDMSGFRETIEDILLSTGRHSQEQCSEIVDVILRDLLIEVNYKKEVKP